MNISSIGSNYTNINTSQSFKGLWGRTSKNIDVDPVLCIPSHYETYYYYPYADETKAEIRQATEKYDKAEISTSPEGRKYIVHSCRVATILPFSKREFEEYKAAEKFVDTPSNKKIHMYLSTVKDRFIEVPEDNSPIMDKRIEKTSDSFINKDINAQVYAINPVFKEYLNKPKIDLEG